MVNFDLVGQSVDHIVKHATYSFYQSNPFAEPPTFSSSSPGTGSNIGPRGEAFVDPGHGTDVMLATRQPPPLDSIGFSMAFPFNFDFLPEPEQ
jgi:hypothetical protein